MEVEAWMSQRAEQLAIYVKRGFFPTGVRFIATNDHGMLHARKCLNIFDGCGEHDCLCTMGKS